MGDRGAKPVFQGSTPFNILPAKHGVCLCGVQVLRGYVGDRGAKPVFQGSTPFDILGTGYQRPFELATLRLFNMVGILPKCEL